MNAEDAKVQLAPESLLEKQYEPPTVFAIGSFQLLTQGAYHGSHPDLTLPFSTSGS